MLDDCSQQAGRSVAGLTSIFGGLFSLPHALASQHEGFSSCRWRVAKGLQCVEFLIKILLHSHNVIDTCPNPNNIRYRSTCGSGWRHRLYGFYDFKSFKQEGKKSKSDMIGEVWQLQDPASLQAAFPRLIPHLHNTVCLERALVNGLFKYVWLQWAHHRSCAQLCATATTKLGTGHTFHSMSQYFFKAVRCCFLESKNVN